MKLLPLLIAALVAAVILGCGGGGGGGTSSTATGTTSGDVFVTQLIAESSPGVQVDPTNLQVGETVTFELAKIDTTTRTYNIVPNGGFTTTDTSGLAGSLNTRSGVFTAHASTNGTTYTISTTVGSQYSTLYAVTPVQARVSGFILDSNGVPVEFPVVLFYDSSNHQVGKTTATVSGTFNGSVPMTATRFNLLSTSLDPSEYYQAFTFGAGTYAPLILTCNAPLPTLTVGQTVPLISPVYVAAVSDANGVQNTPPPPPTCSP